MYLLLSLSLHSRSPRSRRSRSSLSLARRSSLSSIDWRFCSSYARILASVVARSDPIEWMSENVIDSNSSR